MLDTGGMGILAQARLVLALLVCAGFGYGQSLGNAGTINGSVTDPSGGVVAAAQVTLHNAISGYNQAVSSGADGVFRLVNIPPGAYHLEVNASGFTIFTHDVTIRNSVPITVDAKLTLAGAKSEVSVEAFADTLVNDPSSHTDVDRTQLLKLPDADPSGGLSQAIVYSTGGVSADANGFFHPLGDHSQVSFVVDGQPISDQQSKLFSTQLPTNAVQSMEANTGTPAAEFGDKSSLVAQITTRSGLGAGKVFGDVDAQTGSFGLVGGGAALGFGNEKYGNFIAVGAERTNRFLDTPEFVRIHDAGNGSTIFDRFDYQPDGKNVFHLNLFAARNWFQIPNDYDQLSQDQHQRVMTWSVAPGYQHTFNAHTLMTVNPYLRKDQVDYYASRNPFNDTPATQGQSRQLLNWGVKADVASTIGHHSFKVGLDLKQTRLLENFDLGITDPTFNAPCLDPDGSPAAGAAQRNPGQCKVAGLAPNTDGFSAGIAPFDLTRGGSLLRFHATRNINQYAVYAQDTITLGKFVASIGLRLDQYDGIVSKFAPEPRFGLSYSLNKTGTVLRVAGARTMETPFNENLLIANASGQGGLAQNVFAATPVGITPGGRNQYNAGFQQSLGRYALVDMDYFWKFTRNAFDFSTLLNSTLTFPVAWHKSSLDGLSGRVSTTNLHGFQASLNFGHTRARFFGPQAGGLIPQGAGLSHGVFRIDHDQAFESTLSLHYQRPKNAEWISFVLRYDSGQVVSGVPDTQFAMENLTPNQQVTIGLACGGTFATVSKPIDTCKGPVTSTLLTLPATGTENDDHNPDRVKSRNVVDLGFGTDNLLHVEGTRRVKVSLELANLTNKIALYNFLSTFSGTHFLQPRAAVLKVSWAF